MGCHFLHNMRMMRIDAHPMRIGRCIRMANPTPSPAQLKVALKKSMARGLNLQSDIMDRKTQALDKNNDKMLCTVNSAGDRVVFG